MQLGDVREVLEDRHILEPILPEINPLDIATVLNNCKQRQLLEFLGGELYIRLSPLRLTNQMPNHLLLPHLMLNLRPGLRLVNNQYLLFNDHCNHLRDVVPLEHLLDLARRAVLDQPLLVVVD